MTTGAWPTKAAEKARTSGVVIISPKFGGDRKSGRLSPEVSLSWAPPLCAAVPLDNTAAVKAASAGLPCILRPSFPASGCFQGRCDRSLALGTLALLQPNTDHQLGLLGFSPEPSSGLEYKISWKQLLRPQKPVLAHLPWAWSWSRLRA